MSNNLEQLDYEITSQLLSSVIDDLSPAELQGAALAFISLNKSKDAQLSWAKYLLELFEGDIESVHPDLPQLLGALFIQAEQCVKSDDYNVTLCLPNDDAPLETRVEALGLWCSGFTYAVGISAKPELLQETSVQEALQDMVHMTNIILDPQDPEEDERAYFELVEYLRMVPMLMYQHALELRPESETMH